MAEITFDTIKKANETISTTDIKGKDYAEVNQRVKAFRMVYPTGYIKTEMTYYSDDAAVVTCEVGYYLEGNAVPLATGSAREEKSASYINKTSFIENCETSAVGRALGFAGFGIDTSICSAEELENALEAQNQREEPKKEEPKKEENETVPALRKKLAAKVKDIIGLTGQTKESICDYLFDKCGMAAPTTAADYQKLIDYADVVITDNKMEVKDNG